ncbi:MULTISPECIES: leucine-rich repeat domain-containing protein [Rhizobium]|uniref:leucine-rich repeat domain-containing protein n=1 Tax=Rhizobium TaxID=379 RepID=UPI001038C92C|nr:leucine-rich repeat domain-containing protein [Rhizobium leguminosarum]TCA01229.1 hypothetical protein E0H57_23530 [Rhizobium leguminosarum bv. viciae]UFW81000.1 leucine-rich repeat domain-containing protein [Rhizobium leguminosarum bv. viciae]
MSEVLFEADERTMDNLMRGPHVIVRTAASRFAKKEAAFNKEGFEKYGELIDQYECDGFSIEVQDVAEGRLQEYFAPSLDGIKNKDAIGKIGISGSGAFAKDFDLDRFKRFGSVKAITAQDVPFGDVLPDLFPQLEAWLNLDWKANKIKALNGKWPNLANLSLQGFSGSLSIFEGAPIKRLFLIASTIKDAEDILRFKEVEVLQISSCKIAGDVSVLSQLKKLRSLRIYGKNKLEGWENLKNDIMQNLEISHLPCKLPKERFPKLRNYVINAYRPRDPFYEEGGDLGKLGRVFSSIFD